MTRPFSARIARCSRSVRPSGQLTRRPRRPRGLAPVKDSRRVPGRQPVAPPARGGRTGRLIGDGVGPRENCPRTAPTTPGRAVQCSAERESTHLHDDFFVRGLATGSTLLALVVVWRLALSSTLRSRPAPARPRPGGRPASASSEWDQPARVTLWPVPGVGRRGHERPGDRDPDPRLFRRAATSRVWPPTRPVGLRRRPRRLSAIRSRR